MNKETYEALKLLVGLVKRNINKNMIVADEKENPKEYSVSDLIRQVENWIGEEAKEYTEE